MFKGLLEPDRATAQSSPQPKLKGVKLAKALSLAASALAALPPETRQRLLATKAASPAAGLLQALGIAVSSVHVAPGDIEELLSGALALLDPQVSALLSPLLPLIDAKALADRINSQMVGPVAVALQGGVIHDENS